MSDNSERGATTETPELLPTELADRIEMLPSYSGGDINGGIAKEK